jgi:hypothetical protein
MQKMLHISVVDPGFKKGGGGTWEIQVYQPFLISAKSFTNAILKTTVTKEGELGPPPSKSAMYCICIACV